MLYIHSAAVHSAQWCQQYCSRAVAGGHRGLHRLSRPEGDAGLAMATQSEFQSWLRQCGTVAGRDVRAGAVQALASVEASGTWEAIKEHRLNRHRNAMLEVEKHCHSLRLQLLLEPHHSHEAILHALEAVGPEDIRAFRQELLQTCHVEALVEGNMSADTARGMMGCVATTCWRVFNCCGWTLSAGCAAACWCE